MPHITRRLTDVDLVRTIEAASTLGFKLTSAILEPDGGYLVGFSSEARPCHIGDITLSVNVNATPKVFTLPSNLHAGDCEMAAGSSLTVRPDGTAAFQGTVRTNDRRVVAQKLTDIWHQDFTVMASGVVVAQFHSDGPDMNDNEFHEFRDQYQFSPAWFCVIDTVVWVGCC